MRWFGLRAQAEGGPVVSSDGLYLRPPRPADHANWARLREASREHLAPWEPTWAPDELSAWSFGHRLRRYEEEAERDEARHFFIFRTRDDALLGGLTLGEIRRGVSQTGTLGYWMGKPYAGQGNMTRAVAAATRWGFSALRLHRIEAACVVSNTASARLLARAGFVREGRARAYLKIDGAWQDHELFALLASDLTVRG